MTRRAAGKSPIERGIPQRTELSGTLPLRVLLLVSSVCGAVYAKVGKPWLPSSSPPINPFSIYLSNATPVIIPTLRLPILLMSVGTHPPLQERMPLYPGGDEVDGLLDRKTDGWFPAPGAPLLSFWFSAGVSCLLFVEASSITLFIRLLSPFRARGIHPTVGPG